MKCLDVDWKWLHMGGSGLKLRKSELNMSGSG